MPEDPKRDVAAEEQVREHGSAIASLIVLLTADAQLIGAYKEAGGGEGGSGAEGAKQAARSTLTAIDGHLAFFRELCK